MRVLQVVYLGLGGGVVLLTGPWGDVSAWECWTAVAWQKGRCIRGSGRLVSRATSLCVPVSQPWLCTASCTLV